MKDPIIYVVVNKSLNMSAGKVAAQVGHAVAMLDTEWLKEFTDVTRRSVIVLEAQDGETLHNLNIYLDEAGYKADYYIDEGTNEIPPFQATALACQPINALDERGREIFAGFPLFSLEDKDKDMRKCTEEEMKSNGFSDAYNSLLIASSSYEHYDGMTATDDRPRFVRKTLKWLRERR